VAHVYLHEVATAAAGLIGILIAVRRRSVLPASKATWVLLAFLGFLALNSVVLGAVEYHAVPASMHHLFWLEHGDALRIVGEVAAWVWVIGELDLDVKEVWEVLDWVLWGGLVMVVLAGGYWLLNQLAHQATTPFDLAVMFGVPLAAVFVINRHARRSDLIRLAIYSGGSLLLYSRTAILVLVVTTAVVLISARGWRSAGTVLGPIAAGWVAVVALALLIGALSQPAFIHVGPPPGGEGGTSPGSSIRLTILRLFSFGDSQIAGYTLPSRVTIWRDALSIVPRSPVFGVGYHDYFAFSRVSEVKTDSAPAPADLFSSLIKAAHNDYLSMLVETGVVGLILFLGLWCLLIAAAAKLWLADKPNRPWYGFMLGFLVSMAGVSAFGEVLLPRTPLWLAPTIIWWIAMTALLIDVDRRYGWGAALVRRLTWLPPRRA
jgi:O-antigen ligase